MIFVIILQETPNFSVYPQHKWDPESSSFKSYLFLLLKPINQPTKKKNHTNHTHTKTSLSSLSCTRDLGAFTQHCIFLVPAVDTLPSNGILCQAWRGTTSTAGDSQHNTCPQWFHTTHPMWPCICPRHSC